MLQQAFDWIINRGTLDRQEVDGQTVFTGAGKVHTVPVPEPPPAPTTIGLSTISGFAAFIVNNIDELDLPSHFVRAMANQIHLIGPLQGVHRQREVIASAKYQPSNYDCLNNISIQTFLHRLQVEFEDRGDRELLTKILADVSLVNTVKQRRQGLGFAISAETGVTGGGDFNEVRDPHFDLSPYRVFPEACTETGQPSSKFLLDIGVPEGDGPKNVSVSLRQADAGFWEVQGAEMVGRKVEAEMAAAAERLGFTELALPSVVW